MNDVESTAASESHVDPGRRKSVATAAVLAAGVVAAGAGLGLALWRTRALSQGDPILVEDFWNLAWDAPGGGRVAMATFRGKPLLVNFWATWCPPCIEELPLLNDFYNQNKVQSWQVLGLAIDKPSAVQAFLRRRPLDFPVGLAGFSGSELGKHLGNPTESLPFSVVIGSQGTILHRKLGRVHPEELAQWAALK